MGMEMGGGLPACRLPPATLGPRFGEAVMPSHWGHGAHALASTWDHQLGAAP